MGNYASADSILTFHFATLTPSWTVLINIGIYAAFFKHTILGFYIHLLISLFVTLVTIITPIFYLLPDGIESPCTISEDHPNCDPIKFPHAILGTFVFFWIAVQAASGFFLRAWQQYPKASALGVRRSQKTHTYSGYIVLFVGKAIQFIKWRNVPAIWIPIGVWELFSIIVYIKTKYYFRSFTHSVIDQRHFSENTQIQKVGYLEELKKGKYGYVVFADYVFDVTPLLTLHPGGYQIIKATQGREVDRFIYGMYSAQGISEITRYSHTEKSFHLLGEPIAKINNSNPYKNMEELNPCQIQKIQVISQKSQIYLFNFTLKNKKKRLNYTGYSKINQIGQYFSLTANHQITRLYTTVNCLAKTNIKLINQIVSQNPQQNCKFKIIAERRNFKRQDSSKKDTQSTQSCKQIAIQIKSTQLISQGKDVNNVIPLLIKVYENGKLTPMLLKDTLDSLQISCTRGQGLKLDLLKPGRVIFIAGGTGFYPFMDLIDLLYKRKLINQNSVDQKTKQSIVRGDSILRQDLLSGFELIFYIAINNVEQLHPMSFHQLNYLASSENFKCTFRVSKNQQVLKRNFKNFKYTSQYFNVIAFPQILRIDTQKAYLCGPPIMLDTFVKLFNQNKVDERKYQFV